MSLKTILYFSIFDYPVTKDEVFKYSNCNSKETVEEELKVLTQEGIVNNINGFYLKNLTQDLVEKRHKKNTMAQAVMPKAQKMANKIAQFPYVRGVAFSGAFAKGCFDEEGDVDFFIITAKNRLWVARTLLVLYKKIVLLNSKKYFCVNYFISENQLNLAEKNKFTAMETVTLVPTHGKTHFDAFLEANKWVKDYFPNVDLTGLTAKTKTIAPSFLKRSGEWVLNTQLGNYLERLFHKITLGKWKLKFRNLPKEDFKVAMKSTDTVSKHHPRNFQKVVIETLNDNYLQINQTHQFNLEPEHA